MPGRRKIYLASPLGFTDAGSDYLNNVMIPLLENAGYIVINPWSLTDNSLFEEVISITDYETRVKKWSELNRIIGENNTEAIKESSGLLAYLNGYDVDSGTAAEIGFAAALHKPIIGYRKDIRVSGDNEGCIINLQVEYFIYISGGKIVPSLTEAIRELNHLHKN